MGDLRHKLMNSVESYNRREGIMSKYRSRIPIPSLKTLPIKMPIKSGGVTDSKNEHIPSTYVDESRPRKGITMSRKNGKEEVLKSRSFVIDPGEIISNNGDEINSPEAKLPKNDQISKKAGINLKTRIDVPSLGHVDKMVVHFEIGKTTSKASTVVQPRSPHSKTVTDLKKINGNKITTSKTLTDLKSQLNHVSKIRKGVQKTKSPSELINDFLQKKSVDRTPKRRVNNNDLSTNGRSKQITEDIETLQDQSRKLNADVSERTKDGVTDPVLGDTGKAPTSKESLKTNFNESKTINNKVCKSNWEANDEFLGGTNKGDVSFGNSSHVHIQYVGDKKIQTDDHFNQETQEETLMENNLSSENDDELQRNDGGKREKEVDHIHSEEYQAIIEEFVKEFGFNNGQMDLYFEKESEKRNLSKLVRVDTNDIGREVSIDKPPQKSFSLTKKLDMNAHGEEITNADFMRGSEPDFQRTDARSHSLNKQAYKGISGEETPSLEAKLEHLKTQKINEVVKEDYSLNNLPNNEITREEPSLKAKTQVSINSSNEFSEETTIVKPTIQDFMGIIKSVSPNRGYKKLSPRRSSLSPSSAKVPETISEEDHGGFAKAINLTKDDYSIESEEKESKKRNIEDILKRATNSRNNSASNRPRPAMRHSMSAPLLRLNGSPINVALSGELRKQSPMNSRVIRRGSEPSVEKQSYRSRSKSDSFLELNLMDSDDKLLDEVLHVKHSLLKTHQDFLILKLKIDCIKRDLSELKIKRVTMM